MSDALAKYLTDRFNELERERRPYEDVWQKIGDSLIGMREFKSVQTKAKRRDIDIYDTTALNMKTMLSAGLHSLLSNPGTEFFNLRPIKPDLMEVDAVALWLEQVENRMYSVFQRPRSRFSTQMHEVYGDLVGFGTGAIFVAADPKIDVLFSARPLSELFVADDNAGRIDTVMRKYRFTARQAVQEWGDNAPERCRQAIERGRGVEEEFDFLHVVIHSSEAGNDAYGDHEWSSFDVDPDKKEILSRGGYHEMPYIVARWEKDSGETYGRGPSWNALAASRMAGKMKQAVLQAGQMAARPPMLMDDDGVGVPTAVRPGAIFHARAGGQLNPPIQFLDYRGNVNIATELIRDERQAIQEAYHHELLQLIRNPNMTATQVLEISAQIQRVLAPILGRIQEELIEPVIDRVYGIMLRSGMLPQPPREVEGQELRIEYISPVARAQKEGDLKAVGDMVSFIGQIAQMDQDVMKIPNLDAIVRFIAKNRGVPPSLVHTQEEVQQMKEAEREAVAQEQQMAQMQQLAQVASQLGAGQGS